MYTDLFKNKFKDPCPGSYYIYLHRRATDLSVFYVGKGIGRRARQASSRNEEWHENAVKFGVIIDVVIDWLSDVESMKMEKEVINILKAEGADLCNKTIGGGGISGYRFSQESKINMSRAHGGKTVYCSNGMEFQSMSSAVEWVSSNVNPKAAYSTILGACRKKGGVAYNLGWGYCKEDTEFYRTYRVSVRSSEGEEFDSLSDAAMWLRTNGHPKAVGSAIGMCIMGKRNYAYGRKWCSS